MTIMGEAPTVDGSEIPNNHLGCIKKPLLKNGDIFAMTQLVNAGFLVAINRLSCFQTQEHLEEAKALNQQRVLEERERLKEEAAKVPTGDFFGFKFWW